jgi:hypothetical protein
MLHPSIKIYASLKQEQMTAKEAHHMSKDYHDADYHDADIVFDQGFLQLS